MLPAPSTEDLAVFTGREFESFSGFAEQALAQATLLFSVVTKLDTLPDDPGLAQLANNAIMQMADKMYLEQPFTAAKASPFASETIGSYSYAKTIQRAKQGENTGLLFWDLAIEELSQKSRAIVSSASVQAFTENIYTDGDGDDKYILGPATSANFDLPYEYQRDPAS